MSGRFDYVKYDDTATEKQAAFKQKFEVLAHMAKEHLDKGRYQALALTALEEAYMWVGKAIRDEQVARRGAEESPARAES